MGQWFADSMTGSMLVALPIAVLAGAISFFSPCVVPLLPGYLSYVTGLSAAELDSAKRGRMLAGTALFVAGFSAVFILTGVVFGKAGDLLIDHQTAITRVLGALTVVLGIVFLGGFGFMQRDLRVHRVPAVGIAAAPLLGVLFGFGWTPCIGPTLGTVMTLATTQGSSGRGAVLALVFSLGLGIPFIVSGLAFRRMLGAVAWVRKHQLLVIRIGGVLMIAVGLLLLTGVWDAMTADLRQWVANFGSAV
ncbi:cytochrome c biogenesis CcdA family protein [Kribbella pratensis]|jgi:cytochrome c-type biogenesis protein|uniref:Cytochrome c-type biogenesis protein n=1 Tax=Kribbella pratensis TaxID=2512112 RepID=A0A4R8BRW7_9ACTN|nr:cytochrome c biogenesis protein CcdA [Kribbella pratensis]TDW60484.1 cytochrome c-type biogenesis protein [Kribbella pratensis]